MAWDNTTEFVFSAAYPSGRTPNNLIDDFTRIIKEGMRNRLDQEHFWPRPEESGYRDGDGGKHRPRSARIFEVQVGNDGYPKLLPTLVDAEDNVFYGVYTDEADRDSEDAPDDREGQWKGTAWVREGSRLRPVMTRYRGKFRFNGLVHFSPEQTKWHGTTVGGLTIDEANQTRGALPDFASDGMVLWPFYQHVRAPRESSKMLHRLMFPVRVGKIAAADGAYTAVTQTEAPSDDGIPSEGLALAIGDYPNGTGLLFAFTLKGLELYTSGQMHGKSILVDGVDIRKHDHSGGAMGQLLDAASMGGVVFQTVKAKDVVAPIALTTTTEWVPLVGFGAEEVQPPPDPDIQAAGTAELQSQSAPANRYVVQYLASVAFTVGPNPTATMLQIGIGQEGNIRAATTVPLLSEPTHHFACLMTSYHGESIPLDPDKNVTVYARKPAAGANVTITTANIVLSAMAWGYRA